MATLYGSGRKPGAAGFSGSVVAWIDCADDGLRSGIERALPPHVLIGDAGSTRAQESMHFLLLDEAAALEPGIETRLRIGAGGRGPGPVLIVLAAAVDSPGAIRATELGADDVLVAPRDLNLLPDRIAFHERRWMLRRAAAGSLDLINVAQLLASAERQAQELKLLHQVRTALEVEDDLPSVVRRIVEEVAGAFGYTHVSLYLVKDDALHLQHQVGYDTVLTRIPIERGVAGRVTRTGKPILIEDVREDPDFLAAIPGLRSEVCVPVLVGGEVVGIFNIESQGDRVLGRADLDLMMELTGFLNLAIQRAQLHSEVATSGQRLRLALEAAGMGTWEWRPGSGEVFWSEQMGPLYGLPPGTPGVSAEDWFELIHPDDREMLQRSDRQFLRFGTDYETEFRVQLTSGAVRWLEGKGKVVERGPDGEVESIVGVTMDITGRKRLEEERLRLVQVEAERAKAREAQRMIEDTLERMTAAFIAVDHAWRFTFVNERARSLLGSSERELAGSVLWEAVPGLQGSPIEAGLRAAARNQRSANFDTPWPGSGRWVEVHVYPGAEGLSIYLQDVTQRRIAEDERRRVEARFRSLVQNASDIILILGRDGTVTYASPAIERVIGQTPSEVVGSDNFFRVHPQDAKRLRLAFVKVARTPGVSAPIVLRFRHRNGSYRWLEVTATNLFDDPFIAGIVANCRDVTERHEAEYNLWFLAETSAVLGSSLDLDMTMESVARLAVMNLADLCIVDVVNEHGAGDRFAVAHRDPVGEQLLHQYRTKVRIDPEAEDGPGAVLRSGRSLLHQTIDDDQPVAWLAGGESSETLRVRSAVIAPLMARGTIIGVLTIGSLSAHRFTSTDLGLIEEMARRAALAVDNARLYRSARAAIDARDQFLSVAAHELRTPITAINGFASLVEREVRSQNNPERIERFVRRLTDAGLRLASLVDDMLDVSRIRLGQLPLRVRPVDVGVLVRQIAMRFEEQMMPDQMLHMVVSISEEPSIAPIDEDRIEQVVSNLLDNAIKYSPAGGRIAVTVAPDEDGVVIQVKDEGIGLPAAEVDSIFRPFGRASNAVESNLPGMGIGLFICRNIIERHGGGIWAESGGANQGTTIWVWLPGTVRDVGVPALG